MYLINAFDLFTYHRLHVLLESNQVKGDKTQSGCWKAYCIRTTKSSLSNSCIFVMVRLYKIVPSFKFKSKVFRTSRPNRIYGPYSDHIRTIFGPFTDRSTGGIISCVIPMISRNFHKLFSLFRTPVLKLTKISRFIRNALLPNDFNAQKMGVSTLQGTGPY